MDDSKPAITGDFVEAMVDRIINELGKKFEELDISLDYIAAALLDDSAIGIASKQAQMGRFARLPPKAVRPRRGAGIDDKE
jgi:hypothetical protein|tara:strand:- start:249 stop:491 length:243 start_codon:yes stop_codon:yes gene_type:complete